MNPLSETPSPPRSLVIPSFTRPSGPSVCGRLLSCRDSAGDDAVAEIAAAVRLGVRPVLPDLIEIWDLTQQPDCDYGGVSIGRRIGSSGLKPRRSAADPARPTQDRTSSCDECVQPRELSLPTAPAKARAGRYRSVGSFSLPVTLSFTLPAACLSIGVTPISSSGSAVPPRGTGKRSRSA